MSSQCMRVFCGRKPIENRISIREDSRNHCRFFLSSFFPFFFRINSIQFFIYLLIVSLGRPKFYLDWNALFLLYLFAFLESFSLDVSSPSGSEDWRSDQIEIDPLNLVFVYRSFYAKLQLIDLCFNFKETIMNFSSLEGFSMRLVTVSYPKDHVVLGVL